MKDARFGDTKPEDECPFCLKETGISKTREMCWGHCHQSRDGRHRPCAVSVTHADVGRDEFLYDINCKKCGVSGAFHIDPKDIQWD